MKKTNEKIKKLKYFSIKKVFQQQQQIKSCQANASVTKISTVNTKFLEIKRIPQIVM
jgi:hypothetical protein